MNKHIAITGASSGIGESLARELGRTGARLSLIARRKDALEALARSLGTETFIAPQDLSDLDHACDWIAPAEAALGPIDVLINNAGMHFVGRTAEVPPERGEALIKLDLFAPLRLTRAVLPAMIARRSGTIVDITAMAALAPLPYMAHYDAAKAGLAAASESLRAELAGTGVHVVTVYPGYIETELAREGEEAFEASAALRWLPRGTAIELASRVRLAIEQKQPRVLYPYPAALCRWFPGPMSWLVGRVAPRLRASAQR